MRTIDDKRILPDDMSTGSSCVVSNAEKCKVFQLGTIKVIEDFFLVDDFNPSCFECGCDVTTNVVGYIQYYPRGGTVPRFILTNMIKQFVMILRLKQGLFSTGK